MTSRPSRSVFRRALHGAIVLGGAVFITLALFLVLPVLQSINKPPASGPRFQSVAIADVPPPPPPPEEEPEEDEPDEPEPPELVEDTPPLDLSQLELALNDTLGAGMLTGDFAVNLDTVAAGGDDVEALFSEADLDQRPRVIHQPPPALNDRVRRKAPGTVYIIFIVDERGRVENPIIQNSSDPVFEGPALAAVKQWRFEPGRRKGEPVRFRMRVPITFPKDN